MPELPYFPFYGSDWLGDTEVRRMALEERAVYIDLLCHAWDGGSIPADEDERARMLGITPRKMATLWPRIASRWESDGNGALINPRLEQIRTQQKSKQSAGKLGGKAKAKA